MIIFQIISYLLIKLKWVDYKKKKELSKSGLGHEPEAKRRYFKSPLSWVKKKWSRHKRRHKVLYSKLLTSGTLENFVFLAVLGWCLGVIFTFIYFYSEIYLGTADVFWCFIIRLPLMVYLTISVAFKPTGRNVLLLVPIQLFSKAGQVFMQAQVAVMIIEGPMMNLKHNIAVIQESAHCQQKGAAAAAAEIADILFGPFSAFREAAKEIVKGIKAMVEKLQKILNAFKRTVMAVADAIQDATKWINSKINGCKTTVGTTYKHCMDAFSWMYDECKVKVPSIFVKLCAVTEFASNLCSSVKPGEYLCDLVFFNIDPLVTTISQRISRLMDRAYTLMHFEINIHHEYNMDSNTKSIAAELKEKISSALHNPVLVASAQAMWGFISICMKFLFLFFVYRYRSKYLNRVEFDNFYIDKKLRSIDMLETIKGNESIFPLTRFEEKKYVKVSSVFLISKELREFRFPFPMLLKTILFSFIMALDYIMYDITEKCRLFMLAMMQSFTSRPEVNIEGNGFIAGLSHRVISAINFMDNNFYYTHFMPCIPNPKPPNSWNNKKIIFLIVLMWFSYIFKPFIMRLRHKIMDFYYPNIAAKRARWLYNRILFKRETFVSLMRIKLKAKYGQRGKDVSIADMLRTWLPWTTYIIGKGLLGEECMVCNHVRPPLYKCRTKDCVAIFCDECYVNIKGVCSLCRQPMKHPDFASLKLEKNQGKIVQTEDDTGLFLVYDEEENETFDFNYQGGFSNGTRLSASELQIIKDLSTPTPIQNGKEINEKFYSFDEDAYESLLPKKKSKAKPLTRNKSYRTKPKTYEETFEMM